MAGATRPPTPRRRCTPKRPRINTLSDSTSCQSNLYPRICRALANVATSFCRSSVKRNRTARSEEHTSELQSQSNLVCRLLLEKKKTQYHKVSEYMRLAYRHKESTALLPYCCSNANHEIHQHRRSMPIRTRTQSQTSAHASANY